MHQPDQLQRWTWAATWPSLHSIPRRQGTLTPTRGERGGYNKQNRTTCSAIANSNEAFVFIAPNGKRSPSTPYIKSVTNRTPSPNYNRGQPSNLSPNDVIIQRQSRGSSSKNHPSTSRSPPRVARASLHKRALDWDNIKLWMFVPVHDMLIGSS